MLSTLAHSTRSPIASAVRVMGMRAMSTSVNRVFVVCCNPVGESFSNAVADSACAGLQAGGKEVHLTSAPHRTVELATVCVHICLGPGDGFVPGLSPPLHPLPYAQVRRVNLYKMPAEVGGGEFSPMLSVLDSHNMLSSQLLPELSFLCFAMKHQCRRGSVQDF